MTPLESTIHHLATAEATKLQERCIEKYHDAEQTGLARSTFNAVYARVRDHLTRYPQTIRDAIDELAGQYNTQLASGSAQFGPEMMQRKGQLGAAIDPALRLGDQQTLGEVYAMHRRGELTAEGFTQTHLSLRSRLRSLDGIEPTFTLSPVKETPA